jgi:hypothetical protein
MQRLRGQMKSLPAHLESAVPGVSEHYKHKLHNSMDLHMPPF